MVTDPLREIKGTFQRLSLALVRRPRSAKVAVFDPAHDMTEQAGRPALARLFNRNPPTSLVIADSGVVVGPRCPRPAAPFGRRNLSGAIESPGRIHFPRTIERLADANSAWKSAYSEVLLKVAATDI